MGEGGDYDFLTIGSESLGTGKILFMGIWTIDTDLPNLILTHLCWVEAKSDGPMNRSTTLETCIAIYEIGHGLQTALFCLQIYDGMGWVTFITFLFRAVDSFDILLLLYTALNARTFLHVHIQSAGYGKLKCCGVQ